MGQTFGRCRRGLDTLLLLLLIWLLHPTATVTTTASTTTASTNTAAQPPPRVELEYLVVGVSGGLQDGFPERPKMDYHAGQADESKAIFLGRALVRGYKAYLDVMQQGWRQYVVWNSMYSVIVCSSMHVTFAVRCACVRYAARYVSSFAHSYFLQ